MQGIVGYQGSHQNREPGHESKDLDVNQGLARLDCWVTLQSSNYAER